MEWVMIIAFIAIIILFVVGFLHDTKIIKLRKEDRDD